MSQRNPMNERYTTDKHTGGVSRKSASSAKLKSAAASSVVMGVKKKKAAKTGADKRARKREERNKEYEAERKYGDPPTKKFKMVKRCWIGFLIASIVTVALSFAVSKIEGFPEWMPMAFLIAAYACIIVTLYLDLGQLRKMRKRYVAQMSAAQTKESRAEQKKMKAAQREAAKKEEENKKEEELKKQDSKSVFSNMSLGGKIKAFFKIKK